MGKPIIAAITAAVLTIQTAHSAPWTQDAGDWYVQAAILGQNIDSEQAVRVETYAEYGLTKAWTLTGQVEGVVFPDIAGFDQYAYRLTGRRQFWRRGSLMLAAEGGLVGGEAIGGLIGGCDTPGGEARLSFGGAGTRGEDDRSWFFFTDAAIREHGNCRRQRFEAGYGQEIFPNWIAVNKVFYDRGGGLAQSAKVEATVLRRFKSTDLGIGIRQEFGGEFAEFGVLLSVETRF
ncbi:MAG: hypothetical protein AAF683_03510 [Pseudomonadota bacterium]